jgi:hypothetical protein
MFTKKEVTSLSGYESIWVAIVMPELQAYWPLPIQKIKSHLNLGYVCSLLCVPRKKCIEWAPNSTVV